MMSIEDTKRNLPDGWRWGKLGEVADVISGQHILEMDYNLNGCGIGYLTGPADFGVTKPKITKWTEKPRVICEPMDVLVTVKGAGVGKINLSPDIPVAIGRQLMAIRGHCDSVDTLFLFRFLATCFGHFQGSALGATVPGLSREDLETLAIPLPPLAEQRRIAGVLREQMAVVDKARTAAQARLKAVKDLPAAFLRQIFPQPGQPLPDGWRWGKLGEVASIISKGTTPTTLGLQYTDAGIPFLRAEDVNGWAIEVDKVAFHISNNADETLSRSRLLPGDFLITIAGSLGRVGYVPPEVPHLNCNQAVAFARLDQSMVDAQYLCFVCRIEHVIAPLLNQKAGGALQNLNLQQIRYLEIPLPPLDEQRRIAAILKEQIATVDKARAAAEEELNTINALPVALLRRAFSGEI